MSSANARQVGGDHYARGGECQHWDWVEENGMGYLEGCASKYVSRWRFKNGVQDLLKAQHYVEKLIELAKPRTRRVLGVPFPLPGRRNRVKTVVISAEEFALANDLCPEETRVCHLLLNWIDEQHLREALLRLRRLVQEAKAP